MIAGAALGDGFADPVFGSQSVFRAVLDAMVRPGRIIEQKQCVTPPPPLSPAAAAIVLTLADEGTGVFLDAPLAAGAAPGWITFHTGAPILASPAQAGFAILSDLLRMPPFEAFPQGSDEFPDRAATLILQVESLDGAPRFGLTGPGIAGRTSLSIDPLPADFAARMAANRALFPRGIDLILVAGCRVAALPRSVRLRDLQAA